MNWISDKPESFFSRERGYEYSGSGPVHYHGPLVGSSHGPRVIFPLPRNQGGFYAEKGKFLPDYSNEPYRHYVV